VSEIYPFSEKQLVCMSWWREGGAYSEKTAIICDGAVRSGKSFCMSVSFALWAFSGFGEDRNFALCGKTIISLRRNVVRPLLGLLGKFGFDSKENSKENYIEIFLKGQSRRFYLFGGNNEGSASLIQGATFAGILFDEAALMPRSFIEQGLARCSVEGSRFWFNCNPESPSHWFYNEWILKKDERNALYLHFSMADNPSLSESMLARYKKLYTGDFYRRFVEGEWVTPDGLVYPMFSPERHICGKLPENFERRVISCDYGTVNPASFGLWGKFHDKWYRLKEFYYDSRREGARKTDAEYYEALESLAAGLKIEKILVDPSAASFIELIRKRGKFAVEKADNDVPNGIRKVADALHQDLIAFSPDCRDSIREFSLYRWDDKKDETPLKRDDHAMDDIRYFVAAMFGERPAGFFAASLARRQER
jgi:PBSX family phage terminase large subunit